MTRRHLLHAAPLIIAWSLFTSAYAAVALALPPDTTSRAQTYRVIRQLLDGDKWLAVAHLTASACCLLALLLPRRSRLMAGLACLVVGGWWTFLGVTFTISNPPGTSLGYVAPLALSMFAVGALLMQHRDGAR